MILAGDGSAFRAGYDLKYYAKENASRQAG